MKEDPERGEQEPAPPVPTDVTVPELTPTSRSADILFEIWFRRGRWQQAVGS